MSVSTRETVLAAVGVAGVAFAVGAAVGLAPAAVTGVVTAVDATVVTGVLGVGLLGYAFARRRRNDRRNGESRLAGTRDEGDADNSGGRFDDDLELASRDVATPDVQGAREDVRERVRETAVRAYARRHGVSREDARNSVAEGAWTDDVVAAAFAGDERAPRFPLRERLRGWVHPDRAYRRRAKRAVDAAHRLATEGSQ
ncbi:DUF7269 family protein [Halobacterium zhouii]|uniref:DUF7269 family protein n=1 Tax=Halobacterium zhouii TaxID=2902624 RepID=UPI001E60E41B|nr:hypothetical protein [Halobacterium zhouii]